MRKFITAAAVAAAAIAAAGCNQGRAEDAGPTVQRTYPVGQFDRIEVAGSYDVQVRTGTGPSASARGPEKMLERLVVEVKDGKLLIHPRENHGFNFHWGSSHGNVEVTVTVPRLSGAVIAGSGDVTVDHVRGDSFDGQIGGSGTLSLADVAVKALKLSIGGSGDIKAAAGSAQSVDYSVAGSGDIDAGGVTAQDATVSIAGSGSAKARATGNADISIMGSGDADISGGAKCNVSKAGSGDARCS